MKKIAGVALVGALVLGAIVVAKSAPSLSLVMSEEGKVCMRLGELCDGRDTPDMSKAGAKFDECVDDMKQARKMSGEQAFARTRSCMEESKTCGAATGCVIGGVGVGAVGEMLKGFGSALSH
ncbi:MAG: hypothetical protein FWD73_01180 [Polyangiaceae bacterium]|nr:hypothetical protein [Polyangiaceae bacterium]